MRKSILSIALASVFAVPAAFAGDAPSYKYLEVSYDMLDGNNGSEADGFAVKGSAALGEYFFLEGDFATTSGDNNNDVDIQKFGLGVKYDVDNLSWFASYNLGNWDFEGGDLDIDTLALGIRAMVSDTVELNAAYTSNDVEVVGREGGYDFGLVIGINDSWGLTLDYSNIAGDLDVSRTSIGARYSF